MESNIKGSDSKSILHRVERVIDDLRMIATPYDSHLFILILSAAFRRPGANDYDPKQQDPHAYIDKLCQQIDPILCEELKLKKYVEPFLIERVLDLAQEISGNRDILQQVWNRGRAYNRAAKMTRMLTPKVSRFCVSLVEAAKDESVACSFTGAFDFVEVLEGTGASCIVEERDNQLLALLFKELFDYPLEMRNVSSDELLEAEVVIQHDIVMSVPTFGMRLDPHSLHQLEKKYGSSTRTFENFALLDAQIRSRRRALVVLPAGWISRTTADERDFKRVLLREGKIEGVIKLPAGSFETTRVPAVVIVMRGFESPKNDKIFMADCTGLPEGLEIGSFLQEVAQAFRAGKDSDLFRWASSHEIAENLFNMDPTRYVVTESVRLVKEFFQGRRDTQLGSIAQIIRPQPLPPGEDFAFGEDVREVTISDITNIGGLKIPNKRRRVSVDLLKRASKVALNPGDVLLSVKGSIGHVAIVPDHEGIWLPGQMFVTLRIDGSQREITSTYLAEFLRSAVGQALLANKQTHGAVQTLPAQDLRELPIPIPSIEELHRVESKHRQVRELQAQIESLQAEIDQAQRALWG